MSTLRKTATKTRGLCLSRQTLTCYFTPAHSNYSLRSQNYYDTNSVYIISANWQGLSLWRLFWLCRNPFQHCQLQGIKLFREPCRGPLFFLQLQVIFNMLINYTEHNSRNLILWTLLFLWIPWPLITGCKILRDEENYVSQNIYTTLKKGEKLRLDVST